MPSNQNEIDRRAAFISIAVHALLLLLCVFISYSLPANKPATEDGGMEVNLGNSEDGSGTDQDFSTDMPQRSEQNASRQTNDERVEDVRETETDDNADAPSINNNDRKNLRSTQQNISNTTERKPERQPKILFPAQNNGRSGNGANINQAGGNEGNGTGPGDKGVAGGTPGASNYTGIPGNGTGGIGHSFVDRTIVARPDPAAEFREGGKVVIRVTVDREGRIIAKRIKSSPSSELGRIAMNKLNDVRFNKSETAPPEQFGDITFLFKNRAQR